LGCKVGGERSPGPQQINKKKRSTRRSPIGTVKKRKKCDGDQRKEKREETVRTVLRMKGKGEGGPLNPPHRPTRRAAARSFQEGRGSYPPNLPRRRKGERVSFSPKDRALLDADEKKKKFGPNAKKKRLRLAQRAGGQPGPVPMGQIKRRKGRKKGVRRLRHRERRRNQRHRAGEKSWPLWARRGRGRGGVCDKPEGEKTAKVRLHPTKTIARGGGKKFPPWPRESPRFDCGTSGSIRHGKKGEEHTRSRALEGKTKDDSDGRSRRTAGHMRGK